MSFSLCIAVVFVETGNKRVISIRILNTFTPEKRLLSAIPSIDPVNRLKNKEKRLLLKEYQEMQGHYYDENGRVYDLKAFSATHQVALPEGGKN